MDSPILKELAKFLHEKKTHRRWMVVFVSLAVIVGLGTAFALKMMGQAMTRKEKVLVCAVQPHAHTEECQDAEGNLICGLADYIVHTHNDDCYDSDGNLACQLAEVPLHQHEDACYAEERFLVCGLEEGEIEEGGLELDPTVTPEEAEPQGHIHTEECYETQRVLACGQFELHMHSLEAGCYEEVPPAEEGGEVTYRLICGLPQLEEHIHTEEAGCFEIHEAHMLGIDLGTETAEPEQETPAEGVSPENPEAAEDAVTAENPADVTAEEPAAQSASPEEPDEFVKVYNGEGYIVTAIYGKEAELPEEAELIAELITPESDKEHYAEREAEYKEQVGDEDATMSALLKVGFYINGGEIEPKAAVKISVQMLDENGLPEGMPMTVVHFAEGGNEVIKGSEVENGKTSFEMNSFSELALGHTADDRATISVSESCTYNDDAFQITFHVTGDAKLPPRVAAPSQEGKPDESQETEEGETPSEEDTTENDLGNGADVSKGEEYPGTAEEEMEEGAESDGATEEGASDEESGTVDEEASSGEVTENGGEEEDSSVDGAVTDEDTSATGQGLVFEVKPLDKNSEEYKTFIEYTKDLSDISEFILLRVVSYSLSYNNEELDLSDCEVTAEIKPKKALNRYAKKAIAAASKEISEKDIDDESLNIELTALSLLDGSDEKVAETEDVSEADSQDETEGKTMQAEVAGTMLLDSDNGNEKFLVKLASGAKAAGIYSVTTANPHFKVQYYSELDELVEGTVGAAGTLAIIDTSKKANGGTAKLPTNGTTPKTKTIKLATDSISAFDKRSEIATTKVMQEIYVQRNYEYIMAPSLNYFNVLIDNPGYFLKEVWVQKNGDKPDSTNRNDWEVYDPLTVHFANREVPGYVEITDKTIIRLVYQTEEEKKNEFNSTFYDYDISSGVINDSPKGGFTMKAYNAGINKAVNGSGAQYAFGNNVMSWLGDEKWGINYINQSNGSKAGNGYSGCAFGLVDGIDITNQTVNFADGIKANEIFGVSDSTGKKVYSGGKLNFKRTGDSYTLTTATLNGSSVENLDKFWWRPNWNKTAKIWENSFWPLDVITNAMDPKFGSNGDKQKFSKTSDNEISGGVYTSDENNEDTKTVVDHNCFFGMYYEVEFDLDPAYVGPLNYVFFGDDDMWTFLDGDDANKPAHLVCDIGGVHSAVGEYIDLWDYLHKHEASCYGEDGALTCTQGSHEHTDACYGRTEDGKIDKTNLVCTHNKHVLRFFYTERGAAGSTCWMHFTLPSVSTITPQEQKEYGNLEVEKKVEVNKPVSSDVFDPDKEIFSFSITLDAMDDYRYTKYDKNHNAIENDLVLHTGSTFHLRDGEYIRIEYLPIGTTYTITEENTAHEVMTRTVTVNNQQKEIMIPDPDKPSDKLYTTDIQVNGETQDGKVDLVDDKTIDGDIKQGTIDKIKYINRFNVYELPKTGGFGKTPYTMAGVIVMFGAGFLYRKKFRERRVRRSS